MAINYFTGEGKEGNYSIDKASGPDYTATADVEKLDDGSLNITNINRAVNCNKCHGTGVVNPPTATLNFVPRGHEAKCECQTP